MELGLGHFDWGTMTPQKTASGDLYVQKTMTGLGDFTIYFTGGPTKGKSNM